MAPQTVSNVVTYVVVIAANRALDAALAADKS